MHTCLTYDITELAEALGMAPVTVRRRFRDWIADCDFPRPLPIGLLWSRAAVHAWVEGQLATPAAANDASPIHDVVAAHNLRLVSRYAAPTVTP